MAFPLIASSPSSGTLSAGSSALTWNGTGLGGASPEAETTCVEGVNCDTFLLTFGGTAADWNGKNARVSLSWLLPLTDYDMYIHKGTATGPLVATSAQGTTTAETAEIDVSKSGPGTYAVRIVYFVALADQYKGRAEVVTAPINVPPPVSNAPRPTFTNFAAPAPLGQGAGEPTLGVNWNSGNVMFISGLETLRVNGFNDATGAANWVDRSGLTTSITTFDPILFTDNKTGRTIVSQLLPAKVSLMAFSDDDGETWTPSQGSGINSGVDHQTVGGGPFKPGVLLRGPLTSYPNAVYYASQDIGLAEIALSRDGGMTFDVAVPMWNLTQCNGLHGHIKVAPDGTVYVPNKNCGGQQAVAVSEDNGLTWAIRPVSGSTAGATDPSVGIASDGTVYLGFINTDGTARVAVSSDRGLNWSTPANVGHSHNLQNGVFPAVVAGDPDRAAMFWIGSSTPGANGVATDMAFNGTWHGYIATTYDGGQSWHTVNATNNDPVQRGVVCTHGTTCPSGTRNLLDFNDLEMDKQGRPVAAFADGCVTADCRAGVDRSGAAGTPDGLIDSYDNDGEDVATIIRQSGGRTLLSAYDEPDAPSSLFAAPTKSNVTLSWTDNAANETGYTIERSSSPSSGFGPIVTTSNSSYIDGSVSRKTTYYYRVKAVNANGSSSYSNVVSAYVK
ncbi:MAG TPA: hypothetical protein VE974_23550 [Thermoanaerobaculia bacterium]|nr:hypothetical protein [Thermoanaerobaculia bacterium]